MSSWCGNSTAFGRSIRDLIDVVNSLQDRGVGLRSLREAIDTTTPAGKLTFHIFAALAEFEHDMIRERTRAGLVAAHKRGVAIGRPRALTPEQILMAEAMTADPAISTRQVAEQFGIHRSTLYSAPQRASETLRLACTITPICLIPLIGQWSCLLAHDSHIETVHYPLAKPLPRGVGHTPLASRALCPWWALVSSLCSRIAAYGWAPKGGRVHGR